MANTPHGGRIGSFAFLGVPACFTQLPERAPIALADPVVSRARGLQIHVASLGREEALRALHGSVSLEKGSYNAATLHEG